CGTCVVFFTLAGQQSWQQPSFPSAGQELAAQPAASPQLGLQYLPCLPQQHPSPHLHSLQQSHLALQAWAALSPVLTTAAQQSCGMGSSSGISCAPAAPARSNAAAQAVIQLTIRVMSLASTGSDEGRTDFKSVPREAGS